MNSVLKSSSVHRPAIDLFATIAGVALAAIVGLYESSVSNTSAGPAFVFRDGFEDAGSLTDLFPKEGSRWHALQREPKGNVVEPTRERARSGAQSLKCVAAPSTRGATSKADLAREGFQFGEGEEVWFRGWFYLAGDADAASVFLWDLEDSTRFHSPGRRIYLQSDGTLASDLGKSWLGKTFRAARGAPKFPRDRWVELRVHLLLSTGQGRMEVWQDGVKVLDGSGRTLPASSARYNRLQVGITANGHRMHTHTLFVDDVVLSNRTIED